MEEEIRQLENRILNGDLEAVIPLYHARIRHYGQPCSPKYVPENIQFGSELNNLRDFVTDTHRTIVSNQRQLAHSLDLMANILAREVRLTDKIRSANPELGSEPRRNPESNLRELEMLAFNGDQEALDQIEILHRRYNLILGKEFVDSLEPHKVIILADVTDFYNGYRNENCGLGYHRNDAKRLAEGYPIKITPENLWNVTKYRARLSIWDYLPFLTERGHEFMLPVLEELGGPPLATRDLAHWEEERAKRAKIRPNPQLSKRGKTVYAGKDKLKESSLKKLHSNIDIIGPFPPQTKFFGYQPETYIFTFLEDSANKKHYYEILKGNVENFDAPIFPLHRPTYGGRGTIEMFWSRPTARKYLAGAVQFVIKEDKKTLILTHMAVKAKWRRNHLNTKMIDALKGSYPGYTLLFDEPTEMGSKFMKKYGYQEYKP